jgi:hypothetical protein
MTVLTVFLALTAHAEPGELPPNMMIPVEKLQRYPIIVEGTVLSREVDSDPECGNRNHVRSRISVSKTLKGQVEEEILVIESAMRPEEDIEIYTREVTWSGERLTLTSGPCPDVSHYPKLQQADHVLLMLGAYNDILGAHAVGPFFVEVDGGAHGGQPRAPLAEIRAGRPIAFGGETPLAWSTLVSTVAAGAREVPE